jgi:hypothetical protein
MSFPPASRQSISRRGALALTEIDALAVNLIHDVRSLEARLERGGLGLAVLAYPELRIIEAGAECIRAETQEARAAAAPKPVTQTAAARAADMARASRAALTRRLPWAAA